MVVSLISHYCRKQEIQMVTIEAIDVVRYSIVPDVLAFKSWTTMTLDNLLWYHETFIGN